MKMVAKGHIHHTANWPQGVSHICFYSKRNEVKKKNEIIKKKNRLNTICGICIALSIVHPGGGTPYNDIYEEVRPKGVTFSDFSNMNLWKGRDYTYERIEKSAILVGKKAKKG